MLHSLSASFLACDVFNLLSQKHCQPNSIPAILYPAAAQAVAHVAAVSPELTGPELPSVRTERSGVRSL